MPPTRWMVACALGALLLTGSLARAQGHGNGHARGHGKHGDEDQGEPFYKHHDREVMRGWYDGHQSNLPPGLQKRLQPCPEELERRLTPPPPDCAHVLIGGHIVLVNRRTNVVLDIVHFEIR